MTPEQEETTILFRTFNKPIEQEKQSECLHNLFETQVRDTPDAVAVVFEGQHLTYAELDARANQLARHLHNLGVQRGTLVGIFAERSLEMIIALYATLKAGAAYVPIDPAYPAERVTFMLQDAQVPVLLTQAPLLARVPPFYGHIVTLEADWAVIGKLPRTILTGQETADDLAYMIYTSGSTGQPKGAMNTHRGICNRLLWMQTAYGLRPDDRVLQKTPFSFDVSVWELFWPLLTGARLVMARPGGHRDNTYLLDLIRREGITTVHFVPSMLQSFVREQGVETCGAVLRCVISSGEALSGDLQALFFKKLPSVALHNLYGPTEAAVDVTAWSCGLESTATTVPIGRPITNIQIYLLDAHWQLMSVGQAGELHIGGVGLARGYHQRPDLTAEKFIPDPFGLRPGERLYKTGDLARYRPDGILDYLGRLDHQVKIRGFRIELGEIEAALAKHPAIRESVAVAWPDPSGVQRLVGYLVVTTTDRPTTTDLLSWLKRTLPDYMLPSQFMFLEALPLTPNGKVDRKALPPPDTQRPQLETSYVSPTTPQELALAGIWSQALEVTPVGMHDNFFELGGDSIRAIQVVAHAQEQGMPFTLEQLFTHQTIHNLVQQLAQDQPPVIPVGRHEPFDLVPPEDRNRLPAGLEDAYPLTQLQIGMFYHNEKNPVSAIFHDIFTFRIQYPFHHEYLQLAIDRFIERHAPMRTSFDLGSFSEPLQLVHPSVQLLIAVEDLQHLDSTAQTEALDAWITAEKRRPFDPTRAPLLRILVHRYRTDEFQLIVSFHHVILDGWSLAVMLTEILQDYSALLGRTTSTIVPPAVPYRTYVASERAALATGDSRKFWTEKLDDPDIHRLPRWPESYRTGGTEQIRSSEIPIPSKIFEGLKALALNAKVPLKSVLLAAHHRVMNALHGRRDVISGIITNGRPEEIDGERMVGLFLNTVPLRLRLDGGTWFELVQQVFLAELELIPHRRFPLADIQQALGGQILFETAFDFVHFHVYRNLNGYKDMGFMEGHYFEANSFVLFTTFMMDVTTTQLQMHIDYDPAQLCAEQIKPICDYYVNTLSSMAAQPHARYDTFSPLTLQERHQQLLLWNSTTHDYLTDKGLHGLFEEQVQRTPDAVALIDGIHSLSYTHLNQRANQLAHHLVAKGVGPDVPVAVCMARTADMLLALLAILKAGGAYVPLDPTYPPSWLATVLEETQAHVLLTQRQWVSQLPTESLQVLLLDENTPFPSEAELLSNPQTKIHAEHLVYVLFTSGSTGQPKGVSITHRSASSLISWGQEQFLPEELEGVLASTSICFDLSVFEIFLPLSVGGTVILAENALAIPTLPAASQITLLNSVPSVVHELLHTQRLPPSIQVVNLAGEPLRAPLVQQLYAEPGIRKVYDLYGPSETTTYSTMALRQADGPETIGRPVTDEQVYLVELNQQLVPVGVAGELMIGGAGLARGYYGRPGLTAEKFIPNGLAPHPGTRLYRTGDRGRYLPDGQIEYLGRFDHQVKVRGFRIELGQIEASLRTHPTVEHAVVLCLEDRQKDKRLVAYVVPSPTNRPLDVVSIRAFLNTQLPDYMIPSAFVQLEDLPLTPNGKVDRKALPAPDAPRRAEAIATVLPRTPQEELIVDIWRDVLQVDQIGVHDNFFELGGHSLLAMRLISRVQQQCHLDISLKDFFENPTVAGLGEKLSAIRKETSHLPRPPLQPVVRSSPLPLSYSQQQLWLVDQLDPASTTYTLLYAWRITGPLREEILERSFNALIERHEALRMYVVEDNGKPRQAFIPQLSLTLPVIDLQMVPQAEQKQACHARIREAKAQPFNLKQGPLIRTALYRLAPDEHLLVLTLHHIVTDGWSMDILFTELRHLYEAFGQGHSSTLTPLAIHYADFAVWQRACLHEDILQRLLTYWTTRLADAPANFVLPTDYPRPTIQTSRGGSLTRQLDTGLLESLKTFCRTEGVTMFMTLLSVLQVLLARHSGQKDILVGTPVAHRNHLKLEGIVGIFLNTLVLRTDLSGTPTFRELLSRVKETCLGAYAHQELPFEKLVETLHPVRDLSRTPLFQVFFNLVDVTHGRLTLPALTLQSVGSQEENSAKFDLTLYVFLTEDLAWLTWNYNTDLFYPTTIAWLFDHFETLLKGLLQNPDAPISTVSVFEDAAQSFPHSTLPVVVPPLPTFSPFHNLEGDLSLSKRFEQMVACYPQQIAIHTAETSWTYAELNRQANRVAHTLLNVLPDQTTPIPVGLLCAPGAPMLAGLLGILKTGHPYVPLEPTLPMGRLETIASDATITIILCSPGTMERAASFRQLGYQIIPLDDQYLVQEETNIPAPVSPNALAYILYTSGTTGVPKGVLQNHRNVLQHIRIYTNNLKIGPHDRLTLLASFSFDAAVMDIFAALLNGATLYPFNLREASFEELTPWLKQQAITIYHSTPTLYRYWLKPLSSSPTFPALRLVVLGGEEATCADFEAYQRHLGPDCFFVNGLGPTESTVSLQYIGCHATKLLSQTVPAGYPVDETEVALLDEAGQVTEIFGEIALRSPFVAIGYWQRPELTQRAFRESPYPGGARQYCTGDLGRYRPDGSLEFMGRKDGQIKLRGYRIELGEIESVLTQHPAVSNAIVLCREDTAGEKQLVAYVLLAIETSLESASLRAHLQTKLPDYMQPAAFVVLDAFPLTPNGKVDWRALPAPDQTHRVQATAYVSPRTPLEDLLADLWRDLLKVDQISVHDNFFALGGHSLLVTQVIGRLRNMLELDLPVRILFEHPTVAEFAMAIDSQLGATFPDWPTNAP